MNEKLTKELKEQFPFLQTKEKEKHSVSLFLFGFECDDGWFYLIRDLCEEITKLNIPQYKVYQVKEKFGGLRFYGSIPSEFHHREKLLRLIWTFESASYTLCELCGKGGSVYSRRGWMKTLCDTCAKGAGYERTEIRGR